jgi:hypothetical protein
MKVYDCEQGSQEWFELRAGIPTSSAFNRIVTPTGKISSQSEAYMYALIAERIMGRPVDTFISEWMERGHIMEEEAGKYYAFQHDCDPQPVGFITTDDGKIGASPDRLVEDDGLLEIKAPAAHTHVGYLFGKGADKKYMPQLQGQLWITGRKWVDIMSYHPELPAATIRIERSDSYIEILSDAVTAFAKELDEKHAEIIERIGELPVREPRQPEPFAELREAMIAINQGE